MSSPILPLADALEVVADGDTLVGAVPAGYDVFGIPHGGFLAALGTQAILLGSGRPDVFSATTHFLRKAREAPLRFVVTEVGRSRRFVSVQATGTQDDDVVLAMTALVGDRAELAGPTWDAAPGWRPTEAELTPAAGTPESTLPAPAIAERLGLRLDRAHLGFAQGRVDGEARIRAQVASEPADVLSAIVACDVTPPAIWNARGMTGWVPTVELTTHVRARPAPGPMTVEVWTRHVANGFLEEDAEVRDAEGTLVVQSRQLARYAEGPPRATSGPDR